MLAYKQNTFMIAYCVNFRDIAPMSMPTYLHAGQRKSRRHNFGWRVGRIFREIVWALSMLRFRDILSLSLWVIILSGIGAAYHYGGLKPIQASASQSEPAEVEAESLNPADKKVTVTTLPSGPTGQLLPPGVLAAPYTYRNTYLRGQCTWYVAGRRQIPNNWGNARTWYGRAQSAGWSVGTTPAVGAIAWTSAGWYGHVAVVEGIGNGQVYISEMNYIGAFKISQRWAPINSFKYIY
jgi:surface antigen